MPLDIVSALRRHGKMLYGHSGWLIFDKLLLILNGDFMRFGFSLALAMKFMRGSKE